MEKRNQKKAKGKHNHTFKGLYYTLPDEQSGTFNDAIVFVDGTMSVTVNVVEICQFQVINYMIIHNHGLVKTQKSREKHQPTFDSVSTLTSITVFLYLYTAPTSPVESPPFFTAVEVIACSFGRKRRSEMK